MMDYRELQHALRRIADCTFIHAVIAQLLLDGCTEVPLKIQYENSSTQLLHLSK